MPKPNPIEPSDPSDFASTSPLTVNFDQTLRCQICKDFFDPPMITSCCHAFCSLCIRQALSTDGRCPICRQGDQPSKLRRNWSVQEVVATWKDVREVILTQLKRENDMRKKQDDEHLRRQDEAVVSARAEEAAKEQSKKRKRDVELTRESSNSRYPKRTSKSESSNTTALAINTKS